MKSGPGDESLMVMTIIDNSSTDDLSFQNPAPESSPPVLTPVSSHAHETFPASTTSPQLKVDTEENTLVPKEESTNASISEAPKAESLIKPSTQNQTVQAQKPAFKNINAPPTAIMRTGNTLQLEHDEYSLYRILSIIHFCCTVDKLHNLDFKAWKGLTVLAETYQWTQVLRPWKSIWVRKHGTSFLLPGYEDWLYLSKVYGSDYQVDALTRTLSLYCRFNGKQISRALAYGSLLQSIKASELNPEFSEWEGSVAELHEQIENLAFSTLGIVIKEHKCVIQGLKKSLSFCLTSFGLLDLQSRHDEMILRASSL
ncbi:hypothetical protein TWF970_001684 [Orbilia oligospora]|uniref:Uncharacterized protein n=1 Tax=Orbilia oligospora TaxID=2813651 RepID=A0A7C8VGX4_ORBOL|nr:hypothetical protein TWF970_001684 [Orbilia oligospora]